MVAVHIYIRQTFDYKNPLAKQTNERMPTMRVAKTHITHMKSLFSLIFHYI